MQNITKVDAKRISTIIQAAVITALADKNIKLDFVCKGGSYTDNSYKPRFELVTPGAAQAQLDRYADSYGLQGWQIGDQFKRPNSGNICTFTGLNPERPKYPVSFTDHKGTQKKAPASFLQTAVKQ